MRTRNDWRAARGSRIRPGKLARPVLAFERSGQLDRSKGWRRDSDRPRACAVGGSRRAWRESRGSWRRLRRPAGRLRAGHAFAGRGAYQPAARRARRDRSRRRGARVGQTFRARGIDLRQGDRRSADRSSAAGAHAGVDRQRPRRPCGEPASAPRRPIWSRLDRSRRQHSPKQ